MAMKRSAMDAHLVLNLGSRSGDSAFTDAQRNEFLNWALLDVASVRNWRAMKVLDEDAIKTRAGSRTYALPLNTKTVLNLQFYSVRSSLSYPMHYKPPEIFDEQILNKETAGSSQPFFYTWRGGDDIEVYPPTVYTGDSFHLYHVIWPEEFDLANDELCPLPRLERIIISMATGYGFESYRDFETANRYRKNAFKTMKRQARADGELSDWTPQWASERTKGNVRRAGFDVPAIPV